MRRMVQVDAVLLGEEPRKLINVYEIFWTGGATGDRNYTEEGERYLFLVRVENGRYHVVRDWWRSIFEVPSGRQTRLPLDDSRPFWERVALMMWWVQPDRSSSFGRMMHTDPDFRLSNWRSTKILRGLLRHPERNVRIPACESLFQWAKAQDECWDDLDTADRKLLNRFHNAIPIEDTWHRNRRFEQHAGEYWEQAIKIGSGSLN